MKKLLFNTFILLLVFFTSNFCLAQSTLNPNEKNIETEKPQKITQGKVQDEINPFSLRPIPKSHIAYQKSIWLQVSFKQKTNLPLWYAGHELSKFLIENALNENITAYKDDKLESVLSKEELLESLKAEENFEVNSDSSIKTDSTQKLIDFSELSILEIKEDYILDIQHSRMVHDVIAFTLILPQNQNRFTKKVVSFSYKEIIEKLFRPLKEDYVIIESTKSNGRIPNLETLIDARFFHGYIVKYDNFKDDYFEDQYATKRKAIIKSMQYEEKLIEFEGCLWTY
ncbi:gliding motility associated protein GldN [Bernardetia litoralis DSM 6794]|uniref:Gliding motility associated protein GldN n=1 Tax=Bernardetia litoralis (strain ATCC 23117 / DSM 6794 / NBRC 15988 / NCIMB 1366 / Fx l1 / Sio-4) TaxID=880071 RepID=I4AJY6_BERLS|nr:gliding motility protein GldN [Bernardetia litoralis]AFM04271.1 gliding motility associated protein GldN [Bernardetia litoralis DSM 6794]